MVPDWSRLRINLIGLDYLSRRKPSGFFWQCILIFLLSIVADVVVAVHVLSLVKSSVFLCVSTVVLSYYLRFLSELWFVQYQELSRRLWITTASALGAGLGSLIVVLYL